MLDDVLRPILLFATRYKKYILVSFACVYALVFAMFILSAFVIKANPTNALLYELGKNAGTLSALLFVVTLIPGIAKRLTWKLHLFALLMIFRRQLGILVFAFGALHYSILRLFPVLFGGAPIPKTIPTFEFLGIITLFPMVFLFITSNNWSVKKLGKWWKRIHMFVYLAAWFLFFHVGLQEIGLLTFALGITALLEVVSLFIAKNEKRKS